MNALTIATKGPRAVRRFKTTAASLPKSFTATRDKSSVVVVAGEESWASVAAEAIDAGARGVVVSDPRVTAAADARELLSLATRNGVAVVFADAYAADPVFETHSEQLAAHVSALSAIIITENAPAVSRSSAVFSILRTLRALGLESAVASVADRGAMVSVRGAAGDLTLLGNVSLSAAATGQRVQGLGYSRTLDMHLFGSVDARPAKVAITTMAGENNLPTVYETADRAAWRLVLEAVNNSMDTSVALRGMVSDLEQVESF